MAKKDSDKARKAEQPIEEQQKEDSTFDGSVGNDPSSDNPPGAENEEDYAGIVREKQKLDKDTEVAHETQTAVVERASELGNPPVREDVSQFEHELEKDEATQEKDRSDVPDEHRAAVDREAPELEDDEHYRIATHGNRIATDTPGVPLDPHQPPPARLVSEDLPKRRAVPHDFSTDELEAAYPGKSLDEILAVDDKGKSLADKVDRDDEGNPVAKKR